MCVLNNPVSNKPYLRIYYEGLSKGQTNSLYLLYLNFCMLLKLFNHNISQKSSRAIFERLTYKRFKRKIHRR